MQKDIHNLWHVNPMNAAHRKATRRLFHLIEVGQNRLAETQGCLDGTRQSESKQASESLQGPGAEARIERRLRKLFRLNSADLLVEAARTFAPGERFDMRRLAERTGTALPTLLAKNRTLSHSCVSRGWSKDSFLTPHGRPQPREPKQFSISAPVHQAILRVAAETQPAVAAT